MLALLVAAAAAAAAAALLPLCLALRGRARAAAAGASVAAFAALLAASASAPAHEPSAPLNQPLEVAGHGYVGSAACRACHPGEHASWHASFHRTMTQQATRATVIPRFDRLELDCYGEKVVLAWRGDTLWADVVEAGRVRTRVERPVVQLTGSHHIQTYWYSTGDGRELGVVPMAYRIDERRWLPVTAMFLAPPELRDPPAPGTWNQMCHQCHTTGARPRLGGAHPDTHVAELGIACEACHGEGAAHVAANRSPARRYALHLGGAHDDTITNPRALTRHRSAEVCGQCHAVSVVREHAFARWREDGPAYRPGDRLDDTRLVVDEAHAKAPELQAQLRHDPGFFASTFWSDGTVRVSGREYNGLVKSPCFAEADAEHAMTCLSCHAMHSGGDAPEHAAWADDQLAPRMAGNHACTQCHDSYLGEAALTAHTHHPAKSSGSLCYNCHMSHTSFGLLKAMRSHTIESPRVATELATGRPNACNQCHLDRTLGWTAEQLAQLWGQEPVALDDDQRGVAASIRWALSGDAGQRALAAWSMGWSDAQQASGTDWMAPFLGQLLADPYHAVRFIAWRSLRGIGAAPADFDFMGDEAARADAVASVHGAWQRAHAARGTARAELLLAPTGLEQGAFRRLLAARDDRRVFLGE